MLFLNTNYGPKLNLLVISIITLILLAQPLNSTPTALSRRLSEQSLLSVEITMLSQLPTYESVLKTFSRESLRRRDETNLIFDVDTIGQKIKPWPPEFRDIWNSDYVRLPYSRKNVMKSRGARAGNYEI